MFEKGESGDLLVEQTGQAPSSLSETSSKFSFLVLSFFLAEVLLAEVQGGIVERSRRHILRAL
jgi:hypothetical protein